MGAVWLVARAGLRSRWRPWLTLAVMVALVGGLAIGMPLGVVAGRLAWQFLAGQLGIEPAPVLSPASLAVLAAAGILLPVVIASVPGAAAARARPAAVLRAE
jgi:hypothetical protein